LPPRRSVEVDSGTPVMSVVMAPTVPVTWNTRTIGASTVVRWH
jgi:hypothetical protein